MVVPLNHLGVELHKAINTNYSETRERRAGRGQTSYYLSFPLQLSSSLEQEADSRSGGWTVHCVECAVFEMTVLSNCGVNYFKLSHGD